MGTTPPHASSGPESRPSAEAARSADRAIGARAVLLPLALTQFVASFASSNMNVAIKTSATT